MPTMIKFKCEICDKKFERTKKEVTKNGGNIRTCSIECRGKLRSQQLQEVKPMVKCDCCGEEFKKKPSDILRTEHNFCSAKCRGIFQAKTYKNNRDIVKCECCNKEIEKPKYKKNKLNFCSKECMGKYKENKIEITCNYCNKNFLSIQSKIARNVNNFCSKECRIQSFLNIINTSDNNINYSYKFTDQYKKVEQIVRGRKQYYAWRTKVKKRDELKCTKCGTTYGLEVHHLNNTMYSICKQYDYDINKILESKELNDVDNGITLCHKCHMNEHNSLK